jgi:hypothetical protein
MSTWPYRIAREQRVIRTILLAVSGVLLIAACDDYNNDDYNPTEPVPPAATVLTATGNITAKVEEYRLLLGDPKNGATVAGPAAAGRREVNWDSRQLFQHDDQARARDDDAGHGLPRQ